MFMRNYLIESLSYCLPQNSQPNIMPMIRPMNGHNMNQNGPINGYNGPMINVNSPQNGPQISHSGSNSPSPFRGNDFGYVKTC